MGLDYLIISMFVTIDDELKIAQQRLRVANLRQCGPLPKLADAEVLTMECVGEFLGLDCEKHIFAYFARHFRHLFPALAQTHRTTFTRQCANLWHLKEIAEPEPPQAAPLRTPGREAVAAYSRARYAKTREEVERQIGEMMGWTPPDFAGEDPAVAEGKRQAFKAMTDVGMPKEQALDLLGRFDLGVVESQIAWLPSRNAKNPARFLAAAIEGGYDRPLVLRRQAAEEAQTNE